MTQAAMSADILIWLNLLEKQLLQLSNMLDRMVKDAGYERSDAAREPARRI